MKAEEIIALFAALVLLGVGFIGSLIRFDLISLKESIDDLKDKIGREEDLWEDTLK